METLIEIGLQQARNQLDRAKFYEIQILAMVAQNQARAAIAYARQVLPNFGVQIPQKLSKLQTILGFFTTVYRMIGTSPKDLLALPTMSDPYKLAACNLFNVVGAAAQSSVPEILPFMTFIGISIYLRYGNIPKSSMAYTIYAFLLCEKLGKIDQGYAIGKAAIALCHQHASKEALAPTLFLWTRFISYRKEPLQNVLPLLMEAYQVSLEVGDTEYAAYSLCVYFTQSYWTSQNLMDLKREAIASRPTLQKLQQLSMLDMHNLNCQILENLTTAPNDACQITGQFFDETTIPKSDRQLQIYTSLRKVQLAILFEKYSLAMEQIAIVESMISILDGTFVKTLIYFYDALVRLAQYPHLKPKQQRACLAKVITTRKYLAKFAKSAPMNYQHKVALVEAERLRVMGKFNLAGDWYDRAIAGAKTNGYLQEEALALELAAKFYLALGKEKIAQVYINEAYYAYARWGATAKVIDLENRYPQLLASLRQQTDATRFDQKLSLESSYNNSAMLDLETLLKASQAISREIELNKLLETLLNILIANAGADKCVLLLQQNQNLQIVAIAKSEQQPQILSTPIPLATSSDVPIGVVNWIKNSLETLVLNDARENPQFAGDRYMLQHQPKSMLCSPILKQGQLLGILYLENNLTVGAFPSDRLEILNLLCTQAAISLENAQLYSTLEQKVAEQTQELLQALTYQQSTQQELIQSEKMAALGQLTASIAHEINTPLGVIRNAASNIVAANHVALQQLPRIMQSLSPQQQQEFRALINTALQSHQSLSTQEERQLRRQLQTTLLNQGNPKAIAISTQLSQMQIVSDLHLYLSILQDPKCEQILQVAYALVMQHHNTQSIQQEVDRAAKIVFALKAYSHHSHNSEQILAKVNDSIEVVLTLYHNRLKHRIEVIRRYDDEIPEILCNPDELTQVWVNLIDNAIYAMGNGGTLEITITTQSSYVVVAIADSGCGMSPEIQSKIFEPFFTSKPRGEGSGLGLDIVRQIVQKHHGEIQVQSGSDRTVFTVMLPLTLG
jgi:signal transduction histidine kinase